MNKVHQNLQSIGQLKLRIDKKNDKLVEKTIFFISQQLADWRDDLNRPNEHSENKLNLLLCKFLDTRARHSFPMVRFDHEEYQTGLRSVDLSASPIEEIFIGAKLHTIYDPILVIECKRLPAPSRDREREYVTGGERISGGIQRFKLGLHGADLNVMVIIGYIQEHSFLFWHQKINEWISELANGTILDTCVWASDEFLESIDEDILRGTAIYRSIHNRIDEKTRSKIQIHHLWIAMNKRVI